MKALPFTKDIVSWLVSSRWRNKIEYLACEVPFLESRRKADLIVSIKGKLTGIEIKSASDTLENLESQINDYKNTFEQIYVAANVKHIAKVKDIVPRTIGIICESNGAFRIIRECRRARPPRKKEALSLLTGNEIRLHFEDCLQDKKKHKTVNELSAYLIKSTTTETINSRVKIALTTRYQPNYQRFLTELGQNVHTDDLLTLSKRTPSKLRKKQI